MGWPNTNESKITSKATDKRSNIKQPKPDPVPPPHALYTQKPCNPFIKGDPKHGNKRIPCGKMNTKKKNAYYMRFDWKLDTQKSYHHFPYLKVLFWVSPIFRHTHNVRLTANQGSSAVVSKFTNAIQDQINNLLANRIVPACKIVGCVLFSGDQLFWMKELTVSASAHLINDCGLLADGRVFCSATPNFVMFWMFSKSVVPPDANNLKLFICIK